MKMTWMKSLANMRKNTPNELLLLPLSVRSQKTSAMVDLGAAHNFISYNILDIIKSALHKWTFADQPSWQLCGFVNKHCGTFGANWWTCATGYWISCCTTSESSVNPWSAMALYRKSDHKLEHTNIMLVGHTTPVVTSTINSHSKHSATLCTTKQMYNMP